MCTLFFKTRISLYHRKYRCFKKRRCVQYCWISSFWYVSCLINIDSCYIKKKKESNKDHSNDSDNASHNEVVSQTSTELWLTVDALTWHCHVQKRVVLIFWGFLWNSTIWNMNDYCLNILEWCGAYFGINDFVIVRIKGKHAEPREKPFWFNHCLRKWSSLPLFVLVYHLKEKLDVAVHT